jgi:hypothetical protein
MKLIIILGAVAVCCTFYSCYNSKKAAKQTDKALFYYPDVTTQKIRDKFPCTITSITLDTTMLKTYANYSDSIIPLLQNEIDSLTLFQTTDTIQNYTDTGSYSNCFSIKRQLDKALQALNLCRNIKPIKIPVYYTIKDSAESHLLNKQLSDMTSDRDKVKDSWYQTKDKLNWWRIACLITWAIIAIVLVIFIFIKLKK